MKDIELLGIGMTSQRTRDRMVNRLRDQGISDERVLDVFRVLPRHLFLEEALSHRAYEDTALPIGFNQTISQPYIVAKMTEVLLTSPSTEKVLEIGTGSGFQTAVLSRLVDEIYSVERILPLHQRADALLKKLGIRNCRLQHTDGGMGWKEHAPFDAIMVTAAPEQVPADLLDQLAVGGVMVIPVGGEQQKLKRIERRDVDDYEIQEIEAVKFVPLLAGVRS